ncbi:MAG TPA: MBL fold metallo-hydrolase [Sandaracinaceae bacterium LLY-WYZ-13_1]|nr:MBL fold metallo-hydrolase [Sandaracinaceae bacterium LLY-WYZ-13_1]
MANIKAFYDARTFTLTYVVWDPETKDAVVIDPVLDYDPGASRTWTESVDEVSDFVRDEGLKLRYVLETHAHADHVSGSQLLKKRFDANVVIGDKITAVQETFKPIFDYGDDFATDGSQFDKLMKDGETLEAGTLKVEAIATPGHTPACLTYKIDDAIFTGDALFMDDYGTGRCDFPKGSAEDLYDSIRKLYELPDETRVFVGHDYQPNGREVQWETTIGKSKANNPQLKGDTTREQFVKFRSERDATLNAPKLLLPSVQLNVNAGRLPKPRANGNRYLNIPLNVLHPADEFGEPVKK